jgi:hypothetical protein
MTPGDCIFEINLVQIVAIIVSAQGLADVDNPLTVNRSNPSPQANMNFPAEAPPLARTELF